MAGAISIARGFVRGKNSEPHDEAINYLRRDAAVPIRVASDGRGSDRGAPVAKWSARLRRQDRTGKSSAHTRWRARYFQRAPAFDHGVFAVEANGDGCRGGGRAGRRSGGIVGGP